MRQIATALIFVVVALLPARADAASVWGSPVYGDPPGWCTRFSDMWVATVVTNDPLVGTNPERDTFYGFHPDPGYDDWYGYFYGDFRGSPADRSGWVKLLHEDYPDHYRWNFASNGWAVHGHAKQYIAYYNWTFGGQCGLGRYGSASPAPYMADQYGWPVVDVYVDANAPYPPAPRVLSASTTTVSFTWDPVADRGDGAGQDYFEAGLDHYDSWVSVDGGPPLQRESSALPRIVAQQVQHGQNACIHVVAVDRVGNATPDESMCARALNAPPMPDWGPLTSVVYANPTPSGLVGLDSWVWLAPEPADAVLYETSDGVEYRITAQPAGATWAFGDGEVDRYAGRGAFGSPFPAQSAVTHTFQGESQAGYSIAATVDYRVTWSALVNGAWVGPYPMGTVGRAAVPLVYPVEQAQPEILLLTGPSP
jgi:hypothetical protein